MTFLTPFLLLGLGAIAVPVLLHLLKRRERRTFVFPALRYLKRTTREHARIVRLRQLLLLALRIAAVVAAVLAGARLVLPVGGNDDPPAGVALVIDNGLTSAAVVGEARVLDSLAARARQVLARTGPRDQIWVVPAGSPWEAVLPLPPDAAEAVVGRLEPTHVTANLAEALGRAASLVAASDLAIREVVLLSDLRAASLGSSGGPAADGAPAMRIAPPPASPSGNRGVEELQIAGGVTPRAGDLAELQVRVVGTESEGSTVRAYLDEGLVGSATVGPGGLATLPLPRVEAGWVHGRVELEPDDLRGDDASYFAFQATPPPAVATSGALPGYLEEALSVLSDAGRIRPSPDGAPNILVAAPPAASPVPPGSTVILIPPADPSLLPALNRMLGGLLPGWSLGADAEPRVAEERRIAGGPLVGFLPGRPVVRSAYSIRAPDPAYDGQPLLTLSDGTPWVVEAEVPEGGRVVLFASPLEPEATDLPTSTSMLPLMELLTGRLAGGTPSGSLRTGDPIPVPDGATTVRIPDGTTRTIDGAPTFAGTGYAGVYVFTGEEGDTLSLAAVNPEPAIPGTGLTAGSVAARLGQTWPGLEAAEPWPSSILRERRGREVGGPLLALLFLVLLTEGWLATAADRGSRGEREPGAAEGLESDAPTADLVGVPGEAERA